MRNHSIVRLCAWLALALGLGALPGAAGAQTGTLTLQANAADLGAFPAVTLAVTVRDANGVPVPDLTAANFELLEADIDAPRPIARVETRTNPDAQISVILVLDVSGSMRGAPLADAKAAARQFIAQLGAGDRVALLAFAERIDFDAIDPTREIDFTTDHIAVLNRIDALQAGGATPLYDALFKAVQTADRADLGHRAVLLLTDGVDEDGSGTRPGSQVASSDTPIQIAQRTNIPIFTIGLGNAIDAGYLERVARTTGATYQFAPRSGELQATFVNVAERLKQQLLLTYTSGYDCDGATHRVSVLVKTGGRSASDSVIMGPLPVRPGCNPQAQPTVASPTETPAPAPPTAAPPTETPTETPTVAPPTVAPTTLVAPTAAAPTAEPTGRLTRPMLLGGAAAALLAVLAVWAWGRRARLIDLDKR